MLEAAMGDVPDGLGDVALARRYNHLTGASISHREVAGWGILERDEIEASLEILNAIVGPVPTLAGLLGLLGNGKTH
jgi:hypothetical protein